MDFKRKKPFKQKIFNKLLLTSSITIIATVSILFVMITNYYSDVIIQREMDLNTKTLERVDDYFSDRETDITNMIRDLYRNEALTQDLSYALQNGYVDYIKHRLDKYTDSTSFIPGDIDTYFKSYFDQHADVNAISLRSEESPDIEYLFIYNYSRWNRSVGHKALAQPNNELIQQGENPLTIVTQPDRVLQNTITDKRNINNPGTLKKMGELSVYHTTEGLEELIKKRTPEANYSFFLLNNEGEVLYSMNEGAASNIIKDFPLETTEKVLKWDGETYYINALSGKNNYTYIGVIPQKELNKLTFVRGTMWIFIAISTLIAIFMTYSFMRNYSSRIEHIDQSIREVEKGNLHVRIPEFKQNDELSTIAVSFNSMLDELNNYIEQFYVLNMKQQQAELKALQSQINPHFLFNTLEVIRMAAVIEGSKTSSKMIYHLSRLFRYTLESKEAVPLYIELEHTNQYLQLMQLHYPNKLEVIKNIPKELENVPVPKLILQPIVENYMVHGFRKDRNDNCLEIGIIKKDDNIKIQVKDNGQGISEDRMLEIMKHLEDESDAINSIGLKNVHQRLKLKYGSHFGITIQSEEERETIVTILIPVGGIDDV